MKLKIYWSIIALGAIALGSPQAEGGKSFGDGTLPYFLQIYDVNGDGVLSEEEKQAAKDARAARRAERLAAIDTDGDGVISDAEREAAMAAHQAAIEAKRTERFNEADTNGDGCLDLAEFSAIEAMVALAEEYPDRPAKIHDRMDADDDGCVSLEEFLDRVRRSRRHRDRDGGGDGEA